MRDPIQIRIKSRLLTRIGYLVLLVFVGIQVNPSSRNRDSNVTPMSPSTQAPAKRIPPQRVITPTVLTAVAVSTSQINLSWTNNRDKLDGLFVERSSAPNGPWKRVLNLQQNATSCVNASLTAATTYYYRLMVNDSVYSNVASAKTLSAPTDRTPGHLTATATSYNQIDLSWTDSIGDVTGFKIERCDGNACSNFTEIAKVASNVTSYQNTDLTALTSYSYRVRAYKERSQYAYSNIASATTSRNTTPPNVPQGLVANAVSSKQISLSWNSDAVDSRAAGYNVYQYGERIGSTVSTSYLIKRLTPNTQYCYYVVAFDNSGNSSFQSDIVCATTKPDSDSQPENKPTPELR